MWNIILIYPTNQNTRNGSEDVFLMEEADSSGIEQKINKTRISTTSEINNNAIKDHTHTT